MHWRKDNSRSWSLRTPSGSRIRTPLPLLTTYRKTAFAILLFSTHIQSFDSTEQADRWNLQTAFARSTDDTQHNTLTTLTSHLLPLHCAVLRQELAIAQLQLTNCGDWSEQQHAPLLSQSTSTSSPRCSSLLSEKFALCNSSSHSHASIVSEKITEQEQDNADSTQELLCHRHLQAESSGPATPKKALIRRAPQKTLISKKALIRGSGSRSVPPP